MNRTQLEREIAKKADVMIKDAEAMMFALEEIIEECVIKGEKISVVGLFEIDSKEVQAQPRMNPMTGESITCDEYIKPTCRFKYTFKKKIKEATKGNAKRER